MFRTIVAPLKCPYFVLVALFMTSVAALMTAFYAEYIGGLKPCILCIYERYPYGLVAGISLIGLFHKRYLSIYILFCALSYLVNVGISVYHVGVEHHIFSLSAACGGFPSGNAETLEELRAQIMATPVVRCDIVPWRLFGFSMAEYNLVGCFAFSSFSFIYSWLLYKGKIKNV
ncbi:MAG: disulfide bond formation protein B [Alphaproteobacteria bacterium]|jgi:disulfide bond formation protein DsbB|nr:disulfide bond formation protein B [Alphaproteobacteria bacterium]MBT5390190.1 disulfide bond formation protein B [Alphaproteobacteria bacterium]MBT5655128.1 disulfide bond formation protein B [Alphaproteobacteria bacterium]